MPGTARVTLSFASVLAEDFVELAAFYRDVFGLAEVAELESEHFRGLWIGTTVLGFSSTTAYELLDLPRPAAAGNGVRSFLTFEMPEREAVAAYTVQAEETGATVVQPPHDTYYGAWQAVLMDPGGHAFRINHLPMAK
ncbi:VOC family protein [Streptomyces sp. NPDC096057]|uniref:VOC family protein n=1 Tax=Streptomyces sp. NPDC096057 TaxID=3155543 RepID=UPI003327C805